jgi:hypothetical protein
MVTIGFCCEAEPRGMNSSSTVPGKAEPFQIVRNDRRSLPMMKMARDELLIPAYGGMTNLGLRP